MYNKEILKCIRWNLSLKLKSVLLLNKHNLKHSGLYSIVYDKNAYTRDRVHLYGMRSKPVQQQTAGDIITEKCGYDVS
jgi:hypothetical protein